MIKSKLKSPAATDRQPTREEMEELYELFINNRLDAQLEIGQGTIKGKILDVLVYTGAIVVQTQNEIAEIMLRYPETIH